MVQTSRSTSWNDVADWYKSWVGKKGSHYHCNVAIPTVMELLQLKQNEKVLDVGSGQGVLVPHIKKLKAAYTGVELSPKMIQIARRFHPNTRFIKADVCQIHKKFDANSFDAAVFLLSIQDMRPLEDILKSTLHLLKLKARLVIFMVHPCFRIPRQSGWGFDKHRKLNYRRIDSYLSPRSIPMKSHKKGSTRTFHRPLESYISALSQAGLHINELKELADMPMSKQQKKEDNKEIPLFLALRAEKVS